MFDTMPDKYDDLLERVKRGPLSGDEVAEIVTELQKPQPGADPYTLMYLLGRAGDASYRSIVEPYIEGPDDMLARLALWVLCWYWGLTSQYTEQVARFIHGVHWDQMDQCRLAAISIAGDYLATASEPQLLWALITLCENKGEDQTLRAHAYSALSTAMGYEPRSLPFHEEAFNLDAHVDPSLLLEATARIAGKGG
jgi:hypothetical protein